MLSDRSYMRSSYPHEPTSALTWVLVATLAAAVLQFTLLRFDLGRLVEPLVLSVRGLRDFQIWSLATYALLHDGLLHLLFNCLGLFFLGREIAPLLGTARFLRFYAGAAVLGGLCWVTVHALAGGGSGLVGASACVLALLTLFACIYPEREITFLLFLVLPVTLKPKYIIRGLLVFEVLGLAFSELPGGPFPGGIAHSAHLGGMLAGWLYFSFFYASDGWDRASRPKIELPAWLRRRTRTPTEKPVFKVNVTPPRKDLKAEVDRILDKINSQGFGALTDEEKRLLDEAKDMLSRR